MKDETKGLLLTLAKAYARIDYTDDDDATITCSPPARRAACSTSRVPVAFAWWEASGSLTERGTEVCDTILAELV